MPNHTWMAVQTFCRCFFFQNMDFATKQDDVGKIDADAKKALGLAGRQQDDGTICMETKAETLIYI